MSSLVDWNLEPESWLVEQNHEAKQLLKNPLLKKDIWHTINDLGLEVYQPKKTLTINFGKIQQNWLKLLVKLYTLLRSQQKLSTSYIYIDVLHLSRFSTFLINYSLLIPEQINFQVFEEFERHLQTSKLSEKTIIAYHTTLKNFFNVCNKEEWLKINTYWFDGKKLFLCGTCKKIEKDCCDVTAVNISRYGGEKVSIKRFCWNDDKWDLRSINHNFDRQDISRRTANFSNIKLDWFKQNVKKYIKYLCQADKSNSLKTIQGHLSLLRIFAHYLNKNNIQGFLEITRSLILSYLAQEKNINKSKLRILRSFFETGLMRGWFIIEQEIIRDEDYPKQCKKNPDPLSDIVREQIEQNLHKLPDPIARMWIICFFAAMRPSELALLKKDCLVQEGQHWKLVWQRKKSNDYHEIPISKTIAKVVQEQQEYIKNLWGEEWNYLFCHDQELSKIDSSQPKLKPVKKVITASSNNPLRLAICCLINSENILDKNGKLAKFTSKRLRTTRLTQLFEQGHDLAVVSAWAGHKNFATTSTYYTQVSCELIEREAGHIQRALVNSDGHRLAYESLPKSFWEKPQAHKLELEGTHINTPIYGYCGLPLDKDCDKFRACYTCPCFVAVPEKLSQYIKVRDELKVKESKALANGQDVLVEQFGRQADQLDKIIEGLEGAA